MTRTTFTAVVVRPDGPIEVEFPKNATRQEHLERVQSELGVRGVDCEGIPLWIPGHRLTAYISAHQGQGLHRFPANRVMMQLVDRPILGSAVIFDEKPEDADDEGEDGDQAYHKDFTLNELSKCLDIRQRTKRK